MHNLPLLLAGGHTMTDHTRTIQELLQTALVKALNKPLIVTGWVASVDILIDDEHRVVNVQPGEQSPALTTGILAHGKNLNKAMAENGSVDEHEIEED